MPAHTRAPINLTKKLSISLIETLCADATTGDDFTELDHKVPAASGLAKLLSGMTRQNRNTRLGYDTKPFSVNTDTSLAYQMQ